MHHSEWEHLRGTGTEISTETNEILRDSTFRNLTVIRGEAHYDIRRILVRGKWVREFTVRVFLDPGGRSPDEVARIRLDAMRGVNRVYNQGHRLPGGDQLHVRLEFTDDPATAHETVVIEHEGFRSDQLDWEVDASGAVIAHEIGHFLGLGDQYPDSNVLFRNHRVLDVPGVMTSRAQNADARLLPRDAWAIAKVLASQWRDNNPTPQQAGPPMPSPFHAAAAGDVVALVRLAREGHVASLAALTQRAGQGQPLAQHGLLDIAAGGDVHAVAALARAGIDGEHAVLDNRTPVQWLAERAFSPNPHVEAGDLLVQLADTHNHGPALDQLITYDFSEFDRIANSRDAAWLTGLALRHDSAMVELHKRHGLPAVLELVDWNKSQRARKMLRTLAAQGDADALQAIVDRRDSVSLGELVVRDHCIPAARELAALVDKGDSAAREIVYERMPVQALAYVLNVDPPPSTSRPQRPAIPVVPAPDPGDQQPTVDEVRDGLPEYLRKSQAMGLASQIGRMHSDDLAGVINALGNGAPVDGVEMLAETIETNVGDFVGQGVYIPVKINGKAAELHAKVEFDWEGMTEATTSTEALTANAKTKREIKRTADTTDFGTAPINLPVTAIPPLAANVFIDTSLAPEATSSRTTARQSRVEDGVSRKGAQDVKVATRIVFTLNGGEPVTATGRVGLRVPTGLGGSPGPALVDRPPGGFHPHHFVPDAVIVAPVVFDRVADKVPDAVRKVGADARTALRALVSDATIKANLAKMVVTNPADPNEGWVRSEPLLSKDAGKRLAFFSKPHAVEMRLVPTIVQVIDQTGAVDLTRKAATRLEDTTKLGTKRQYGGAVGAGPVVNAGPVKAGVLVAANASATNEHVQERNRVATRADHVTTEGSGQYLQITYAPQFRYPGDSEVLTLPGVVQAVGWAPTPSAAPPAPDTPRTYYGPAVLESGLSIGDSFVDNVDSGNQADNSAKLDNLIADVLRQVPEHEWYHFSRKTFVAQFDNKKLAKGISTWMSHALDRDADLRSALSDDQLRLVVDRLLGPGLRIPLTKKGAFVEYTTTVVLKSSTMSLQDGELLTADKTTATHRLKDKSGSSLSRVRTRVAGLTVTARLLASAAFSTSAKATLTGTETMQSGSETQHTVQRTRGGELDKDGALGTRPMRVFHAKMQVDATVYSHARLTTEARRLIHDPRDWSFPQRLTWPSPHRKTLKPSTVSLGLLVPEAQVSLTKPETLAVTPSLLSHDTPARIADLPRSTSRVLDGIQTVAFVGSEFLLAAARRVVVSASGDQALDLESGTAVARLFEKFAPDAFKAMSRLFTEPTVARDLHYGRRWSDTHASVGVALRPSGVEVLDVHEYQKFSDTIGDAVKFSSALGEEHGFTALTTNASYGPSLGWRHAWTAGKPLAIGGGVTPYNAGRSKTRKLEPKVAEKTTLAGVPKKLTLVKISVDATVVAEAHKRGNLHQRFKVSPPTNVRHAGEKFRMEGAVYAFVTDEQLAALHEEVAAARRPSPPTTPAQAPAFSIPPPLSLAPDVVGSMGNGRFTAPIDLTDKLDDLRKSLAENEKLGQGVADRLLPRSAHDTTHDNYQAVVDFLSDVDRSATGLLNGGISRTLRLEDRFKGRTHTLRVTGEMTAAPEFTGVEHVEKLISESKVVVPRTTETVDKRTALSVQGGLRVGDKFIQPSATQPGSTTPGPGAPSGSLAMGADVAGNLGVTTDTATHKREGEYRTTATVAGPLAGYRASMRFDISIERHGETFGTVSADRTNVPFQRMIGDTLPQPPLGEVYGRAHTPEFSIDPATAATPDALKLWHGSAGHVGLSDLGTFHAEHYFGKVEPLVDAAVQALRATGAKVDARAKRAIEAAVTASLLKNGVSAMIDNDGFPVPLPKSILLAVPAATTTHELELHLRLRPNPISTSVSATVELGRIDKDKLETKRKLVTGSEHTTTMIAPLATAGQEHPAGTSENFGAGSAGVLNEQQLTKTNPARLRTTENRLTDRKVGTPTKAEDKADDDLTRVMVFDAEFRVVARAINKPRSAIADGLTAVGADGTAFQDKAAVVDVKVDRAYAIRTRDSKASALAGELPDALKVAAKDVKEKSEAWRKAEAEFKAAGPEDLVTAREAVDAAEAAWWTSYRNLVRLQEQLQEQPGGGADRAHTTIEDRPGSSSRGGHPEPELASPGRVAEVLDQWRAEAGMADLAPPPPPPEPEPKAEAESEHAPQPARPARDWGVKPRSPWPPDPWPEFDLVPIRLDPRSLPRRQPSTRRSAHGPGIA